MERRGETWLRTRAEDRRGLRVGLVEGGPPGIGRPSDTRRGTHSQTAGAQDATSRSPWASTCMRACVRVCACVCAGVCVYVHVCVPWRACVGLWSIPVAAPLMMLEAALACCGAKVDMPRAGCRVALEERLSAHHCPGEQCRAHIEAVAVEEWRLIVRKQSAPSPDGESCWALGRGVRSAWRIRSVDGKLLDGLLLPQSLQVLTAVPCK